MSQSPPRVLVTGMGVVSCGGDSLQEFWAYIGDDRLPIREWPLPPGTMANRRYYSVQEVSSTAPTSGGGQGRAFALARKAALAALADAGLQDRATEVVGIATGTGMGTYDHIDSLNSEHIPITDNNASFFDISGRLAEVLGLTGPSINVSTACAAGAYSLALAHQAICNGETEAMLAGGAEGFSVIPQACFNRLGALDSQSCRPFAQDRQGTLFGEGAAYLVLESETAFCARGGRRAIAELRGFGMSCDGHHVTAPETSGNQIARAAHAALAHAAWSQSVDAIVVHGTGTVLNDEIESRVMAQVLGKNPDSPWIVPIKGRIGHGGGSAGAFSSLLACLLLQHQAVPRYASLGDIDPACQVRLNRGPEQAQAIDAVMVNAYAFGGNNISLLFTRATGEPR